MECKNIYKRERKVAMLAALGAAYGKNPANGKPHDEVLADWIKDLLAKIN